MISSKSLAPGQDPDKLNRIIIIVALLFLTGCEKPIILHPIEQMDIIRVQKGQSITAPKDGYFLSDIYVKDVMQAKGQ